MTENQLYPPERKDVTILTPGTAPSVRPVATQLMTFVSDMGFRDH